MFEEGNRRDRGFEEAHPSMVDRYREGFDVEVEGPRGKRRP